MLAAKYLTVGTLTANAEFLFKLFEKNGKQERISENC